MKLLPLKQYSLPTPTSHLTSLSKLLQITKPVLNIHSRRSDAVKIIFHYHAVIQMSCCRTCYLVYYLHFNLIVVSPGGTLHKYVPAKSPVAAENPK